MARKISENWFHKHSFPEVLTFLEIERVTTESSVTGRKCPFSSKRKHTDF
jgi:hypothetical protein